MQRTKQLLLLVLVSSTGLARVSAQDQPSKLGEDRSTIEQAVQAYTAAFNAGDAKAMTAHWAPEGVYVSRLTGERVVGREAIGGSLAEIVAAEDKPQLAVSTDSIEFISPNVALEQGTATITSSGNAVTTTTYRTVFVRQAGNWLIDRVIEDKPTVPLDSHYEQLKGLAWMIGDWIDQADDQTVRVECRWTRNKNHISRKYSVTVSGEVESSGLQIIGWDAKQSQIRSWLFDSSGGFVAGTWTNKDDRWFAQSVATLADGSTGSFTSVFRPIDDGSYGWRKIHRVAAGEILPNIDEVIVTRN